MIVTWRYRIRNSPMEKIDPRARWIFSLAFLFSSTMFWDVRFLAFFVVLAVAWYLMARISLRELRRAWLFVLFMMTLMIVVNTLITGGGTVGIIEGPGHAVYELHTKLPPFGWSVDFTLTVERLWFALAQAMRILSISAIFLIIPYSMDPRLYGFTFRGLGLPDRFAFSMDLAFRYVPTLARDFSVTLDAQKARGYEVERVEGGLITQARRLAPLIVPVTMSAILSGEDMSNAMDLRCFGLRPRTWVQTTQYHHYDYALIIFSMLMLGISFLLSVILNFGEFWVPAWAVGAFL